MTDVLTHRGYSAKIEFDAEDRIFFGLLAGIEDGVGFHADAVDGLIDAFREAVDDYLEACGKIGKEPQRPYSGKLMLRVDPLVHAGAVRAAQLAGRSLNQWSEHVLGAAAERAAGVATAV